MTEQASLQPIGKRGVSRTIPIALGIVCILLLAGLIVAVFYYSSTIQSRNSEIADLKNQVSTKTDEIGDLQNEVSGLERQKRTLQTMNDTLTSLINLRLTEVWIDHETINQPGNYYTHWIPAFSASYAGYVSVNIHDSTTDTMYVQVIYTASCGIQYDSGEVSVGASGEKLFPILPSTDVEIRVGNTISSGATLSLTITYYY